MPEITYRDVPPQANEQAEVSAQGQSFWDGALTRPDSGAGPFATLEPGYWKLDGSRLLMEDEPAGKGYCSLTISGETGEFAQPVEMEISLSTPCTATGLTLIFDPWGEEWCSRMEIQWYRDTQLLAERQEFPQSARWLVLYTVKGFDRIRLKFFATSQPQHFLRLEELIIGVQREFDGTQLKATELYGQVDVSGLTLPAGTAQFELVLDPADLLSPQKGQSFTVKQKGRQLGVYYLEQAEKTGPGQYRMECCDTLGLLENRETKGGLYTDTAFCQVVEEILGEEFPVEIQQELRQQPVSGWIPWGSKRDGLLQAAFGAGAVVRLRADGTILLEKPGKKADKVILKSQIFTGATVTTKAPVTKVSLAAHGYTPGEVITLYSEETPEGKKLLLTDGPMDQYQIQGGVILDSGANYVSFQTVQPGKVTVQGRRWQDQVIHYEYQIPQDEGNLESNCLEAEGTMLSGQKVPEILQRLADYAACRQSLQQTAACDHLVPGDIVTTEKAFDGQLVGAISGMTTYLTGKTVVRVEILGQDVEVAAVARDCGTVYMGEE